MHSPCLQDWSARQSRQCLGPKRKGRNRRLCGHFDRKVGGSWGCDRKSALFDIPIASCWRARDRDANRAEYHYSAPQSPGRTPARSNLCALTHRLMANAQLQRLCMVAVSTGGCALILTSSLTSRQAGKEQLFQYRPGWGTRKVQQKVEGRQHRHKVTFTGNVNGTREWPFTQ